MYDSVYSSSDLTDLYGNFFKIGTGGTIFSLLFTAFYIFCMWKIFEKAGKPGWAALIPIYNVWVLFEIVNMKGALSLLVLIPIIGWLILSILDLIALFKLSKVFGKSDGFGVGLILLGCVFIPILAFDSTIKYKK